jgi:tRNA (guanosine-2'-O-)-methyltransferase
VVGSGRVSNLITGEIIMYCGIGIINGKSHINYGTLLRSGNMFGVNFAFIIGKRFHKQPSDTYRSERVFPIFEFTSFEDANNHLPYGCEWVLVEQAPSAVSLPQFSHPKRTIYLLGAEDTGIPQNILQQIKTVVSIPTPRSLNVAVAGSIILYDRYVKCDLEE